MEENWARAARCGPIGFADESGQLLVDEGHELAAEGVVGIGEL